MKAGGKQNGIPQCQLTFNELHGVIFQKTELFISTLVNFGQNGAHLWHFSI
jgi:hypothetical protein